MRQSVSLSSPHATNAPSLFSTIVPASKRAQVISEASHLFSAHRKCKDLWAALQVADYKKEGVLNEAAVIVLFEREKEKFKELLLVNSSEELVSLLDEFEDGFLTEDEQILIFSLIRERMQKSAEDLCAIHEYTRYKEMMRAVRVLEADIVVYQDTLRKHTHEKELSAYRELGEDKLKKFREDWRRRFEQFQIETRQRMDELHKKQSEEVQQAKQQLQRQKSSMGTKPSARLRNLQVEERLVAINERFNEAQKIRNELKVLEMDEQARASHYVENEEKKLAQNLSQLHEKEEKLVQLKIQTAYNRLKIEMKQQFTRLQKEIKLHLNDLTKNQNLASKLARKLGETRNELRRSKQKAKEMMKLMSEAKEVPTVRQRGDSIMAIMTNSTSLPLLTRKTMSSTPISMTMKASVQSTFSSQSPLREHIKNVTRFNIAPEDPNAEGPLTTAGPGPQNKNLSLGRLTDELGKRSAKTALRSLGELYNELLEPKYSAKLEDS